MKETKQLQRKRTKYCAYPTATRVRESLLWTRHGLQDTGTLDIEELEKRVKGEKCFRPEKKGGIATRLKGKKNVQSRSRREGLGRPKEGQGGSTRRAKRTNYP